MASALLVRLLPTTPWRFGSETGAAGESDGIYHSDSLYSALCSAFAQLGWFDEWLAATATSGVAPAVSFSSCFPFQGDTLYAPPPRNLWPPALSAKVRWHGARFVPLGVIHNLMHDKPPSEENWIVDGQSGCLLAVGRGGMATGPFRILRRTTAAVDRLTGVPGPASDVAVAQFLPQAGLWFVAAFASDEAQSVWGPRLESALRLLADTGFGGRRSHGFGRAAAPEIRRGDLSALLGMLGKSNGETTAWWMLSLFVPAESDQVDWTQGHYSLTNRGGRIESQAGWGTSKKSLRMVTEGSVLLAPAAPVGTASDVAPDGFAHPVFRAGFALPVPISWRVSE